jgi:hypothetical protein
MFSTEQYRAKAGEYAELSGMANGANELREFQRLERSFTELADNAQWLTDNHSKIVPAAEPATTPLVPDAPAQRISQQ